MTKISCAPVASRKKLAIFWGMIYRLSRTRWWCISQNNRSNHNGKVKPFPHCSKYSLDIQTFLWVSKSNSLQSMQSKNSQGWSKNMTEKISPSLVWPHLTSQPSRKNFLIALASLAMGRYPNWYYSIWRDYCHLWRLRIKYCKCPCLPKNLRRAGPTYWEILGAIGFFSKDWK